MDSTNPERQSIWLRRWPWILLLIVCAAAYYGSYYRHGINFRDEGGTLTLLGQRLLNGEIPFIDVDLGYNVGWFVPIVGLFKVTGVDFVALRVFFFALSTLAAILGFLTVERAGRHSGRPATAIVLGVITGLILILTPGMTFKNFNPLAAVANSWCLLHFVLAPDLRSACQRALIGGLVLGATWLVRIDLGTFFTVLWLGTAAARVFERKFLLPVCTCIITVGAAQCMHLPIVWDAAKRGYFDKFAAAYPSHLKALWNKMPGRGAPQIAKPATHADNAANTAGSADAIPDAAGTQGSEGPRTDAKPPTSVPNAERPNPLSPDAPQPLPPDAPAPPPSNSPSGPLTPPTPANDGNPAAPAPPTSPAPDTSPSSSSSPPVTAKPAQPPSSEPQPPGPAPKPPDSTASQKVKSGSTWSSETLGRTTWAEVSNAPDKRRTVLLGLFILTYLPILTILLLIPCALGLWCVAIWRGRDPRTPLAALVLLGGALTMFPQFFFWRPDAPHLSEFGPGYWTAVLGCLALFGVGRTWKSPARWFTALLLLTAIVWFIRIFPDRWCGTIAARFDRDELFQGENGVRVYEQDKTVAWMNEILTEIRARSGPNDYLIAYPYHPAFNVLANRPTYERSLYIDNATASKSWPRDAVSRIQQKRPAIIIVSNWALNGSPESEFRNWAAKVYQYIQKHYDLIGTYDAKEQFELYARKSSVPPPAAPPSTPSP